MFWKRAAATGEDDASEIKSLYAALDHSQAVIWFDTDGKILRANAVSCRQFGMTEAELVGKHHDVFLPNNGDGSKAGGDLWRSLKAGENVVGDVTWVAHTGQHVYLSASYNVLHDAEGKVTRDCYARAGSKRAAKGAS